MQAKTPACVSCLIVKLYTCFGLLRQTVSVRQTIREKVGFTWCSCVKWYRRKRRAPPQPCREPLDVVNRQLQPRYPTPPPPPPPEVLDPRVGPLPRKPRSTPPPPPSKRVEGKVRVSESQLCQKRGQQKCVPPSW